VVGGTVLGVVAATRPLQVRGVPILRYRVVGPPLPGSPLNELRVPISKFEAQIRHLGRRGFRAVTLGEALSERGSSRFLARNPICLTFDGPYASLETVALPILRSYGLNVATVFYPPECLGQSQLRFTEGRPEPVLDPDALRRLGHQGIQIGVQAIFRADGEAESIGSVLRAGRQAVADLTGEPANLVSLPFPAPLAMEAARLAGFDGAATLGDGVLFPRSSRFAIPRFAVTPKATLVEVALVVSRRVGKTRW